jgi:hypothetical protein
MPEGLFSNVYVNSAVIGLVAGFAGAAFRAWWDRRDRKRSQRMAIFVDLMATRAQILHPRHVEAINGAQVAFYGDREVMDRWHDYFKHLNAQHLSSEVWGMERSRLMTALLQSMARVLGYSLSTADIDAIYSPAGHTAVENSQMSVLHGLANALSSGVLAVRIVEAADNGSAAPQG